jgi:hypothetical protein
MIPTVAASSNPCTSFSPELAAFLTVLQWARWIGDEQRSGLKGPEGT